MSNTFKAAGLGLVGLLGYQKCVAPITEDPSLQQPLNEIANRTGEIGYDTVNTVATTVGNVAASGADYGLNALVSNPELLVIPMGIGALAYVLSKKK